MMPSPLQQHLPWDTSSTSSRSIETNNHNQHNNNNSTTRNNNNNNNNTNNTKRKSILISNKVTNCKCSKFYVQSLCCIGLVSFVSISNYIILLSTITISRTSTFIPWQSSTNDHDKHILLNKFRVGSIRATKIDRNQNNDNNNINTNHFIDRNVANELLYKTTASPTHTPTTTGSATILSNETTKTTKTTTAAAVTPITAVSNLEHDHVNPIHTATEVDNYNNNNSNNHNQIYKGTATISPSLNNSASDLEEEEVDEIELDSVDTSRHIFPSPYTTYQGNVNTSQTTRFAYAYIVSGCSEDGSHRNYLYDICISTYLQREAGSIADVIVYIQMAYISELDELEERDQMLLSAMNIHIKYIPKAIDESFYRTMLDKFLILGLTQYERILYMDTDVLVRGNLDYLFDMSVRGILQKNIIIAGGNEPASGGFFMITPRLGATKQIMSIIRNKEDRGAKLPYPHWDETIGWGHTFDESKNDVAISRRGRKYTSWNFYGAFADQGLLYQWVKYEEKSVSILFRTDIENWHVNKKGEPYLVKKLKYNIFDDYRIDRICWTKLACLTPFMDFEHLSGRLKPWLASPPEGYQNDNTTSPSHLWYNTLYVLNNAMQLGIDFTNWKLYRPYLGLYPTYNAASKTTYSSALDVWNHTFTDAVMTVKTNLFHSPYNVYKRNTTHAPRFAYAYVISGCNEKGSHRNYLYDIAISTYKQREAGSTADVIIYLQMAYKSDLTELEENDQMLLDAMNIHLRYIPKAEDESFYRTMIDKFLILGLTQYERVLFMDGDVMARGNLDYLFELSARGILKRNVVTAGKDEPANGGFFMLAPSISATQRIMSIIRDKEIRGAQLPYPHWDESIGWGHEFDASKKDFAVSRRGHKFKKWNFYGAFADQGLLYQWVKYEEKSVSILFNNKIENWDVDVNDTLYIDQVLSLEIFDDYKVDRVCFWGNLPPCKAPFSDFIHFTGVSKPWLRSPPAGFQNDAVSSPSHEWYNTLYILNDLMHLGIDFTKWRQHQRPLLGLYPTHHTASKTKYHTNETLAVQI